MQLLIGWIIAGALIVILLWTNPSDIKAVLLQAGGHPWPLLLLWLFIGMSCGGMQVGMAIALDHNEARSKD
ncbi:hypothetical protein [uncultured Ferrovibrio sp.]|jgi:hypothetical protein|uniref:hypothetical protein n=1 Tax=uncultured Ferrovibrio sp. TaxID=1576913 RepID=UPI0026235428|nr:hypothetical protein [uncultured Ferrovibrio sp.]